LLFLLDLKLNTIIFFIKSQNVSSVTKLGEIFWRWARFLSEKYRPSSLILTGYFFGQELLFTNDPFWAIFGQNWAHFFSQTSGHTDLNSKVGPGLFTK
jgi:hypothetical protein